MEDKEEDIGMRKENNSCILKEFAADEMGGGGHRISIDPGCFDRIDNRVQKTDQYFA